MTLLAVFGTLAILASADIPTYVDTGTTLGHVRAEGSIFLVSLIGALLPCGSCGRPSTTSAPRPPLLRANWRRPPPDSRPNPSGRNDLAAFFLSGLCYRNPTGTPE